MLRWWVMWVIGFVLLAAPAWSAPPSTEDEASPSPDIRWILENSYLGESQRDRLRLSFQGPDSEPWVFPLDLPGVDLEWGQRLLEDEPEIGVIAPESVVGLE